MTDPLYDTLFRPTTLSAVVASAPPVRASGTRSRAGNAMNRTRAALMIGAADSVQANGTKITMAQVAAAGGVAKATLYNHFRTRDAVLAALLETRVEALIEAHAGKPLGAALRDAAVAISADRVRRALAEREPAVLTGLARVDPAAPGWQQAREAVEQLLARDGRTGGATVVRWLASFLVNPAGADQITADLEILIAGLPPAAGDPVATDEVARPA